MKELSNSAKSILNVIKSLQFMPTNEEITEKTGKSKQYVNQIILKELAPLGYVRQRKIREMSKYAITICKPVIRKRWEVLK